MHATDKGADAVLNCERFNSKATLGKLASDWPAARLVEIYNSLPRASPVKKFTDRKIAVSRVWRVLQTFAETAPVPEKSERKPAPEVAGTAVEQGGETAVPETVPTTPVDAHVGAQLPDVRPEAAPLAQKATARAKKASKTAETGPRQGSKTSQVVAMLKREGGATVEEIMTAMGWLKHTTRAMLSAGGSLMKNHGLIVTSAKVGERRTYSIKA